MLTKICSICRKEKPLSAFSPAKRYKHGVSSRCRDCHNEYHRVWQKNYMAVPENRAKRNEAKREWTRKHYKENKEKLKAYRRNWYAENWTEERNEAKKKSRKKSYYKIRNKVIEHYGNRCTCCGFTHVSYKFFALDQRRWYTSN